MEKNKKLPQLIILYGPPGSGKGTQANLLKDKFGYDFLDFGQSFRDFVKTNHNTTNNESKRAERVNNALLKGEPILTEDFFYILKSKILLLIKQKKQFIIDKPGSLKEEAKWLSQLIKENNISCVFIHYEVPKSIALERIMKRWYLPNNPSPFSSKEEASKYAQSNELPFQRKEDESYDLSSKRIDNMYNQHAEIMQIYSKDGIKINNIAASQTIDMVFQSTIEVLEKAKWS
ncbi:MAG: nucleoside monophosphate kinase [Patescibacteria group bacterium]